MGEGRGKTETMTQNQLAKCRTTAKFPTRTLSCSNFTYLAVTVFHESLKTLADPDICPVPCYEYLLAPEAFTWCECVRCGNCRIVSEVAEIGLDVSCLYPEFLSVVSKCIPRWAWLRYKEMEPSWLSWLINLVNGTQRRKKMKIWRLVSYSTSRCGQKCIDRGRAEVGHNSMLMCTRTKLHLHHKSFSRALIIPSVWKCSRTASLHFFRGSLKRGVRNGMESQGGRSYPHFYMGQEVDPGWVWRYRNNEKRDTHLIPLFFNDVVSNA